MNKDQLRQIYKQKRLGLSGTLVKQLDEQLLAGLQSLDYSRISFIHVYRAIHRLNEYDTQTYIAWLRRIYPAINIVISKSYFETGMMRHFILSDRAIIADNKWGIPEPINDDELIEVMPVELDAVLIPLLVCDRYGNRLGYGKGFYDRFLKDCRQDVSKVGVAYFGPIDKRIPVDEWDIPLEKLVCPDGIVDFKRV